VKRVKSVRCYAHPHKKMDIDQKGPADVEKAVPHHGSMATNGTSSELPWVEK